jgi:hypothetical protein
MAHQRARPRIAGTRGDRRAERQIWVCNAGIVIKPASMQNGG